MRKKLIEIKNLSKKFGENEIIKNISLDIYEGEFLTLLGPSGCGKTTLLRMLAGFEYPTNGAMTLGEENLLGVPANKRQINTVFQSYALFPHLSVRDNITYGLKIKKVPAQERNKRVQEMLELTSLETLANRKPHQLSGGQQQRVAIARSLVNRPQVLLLDEPLGALDLKLRRQMQMELKRLQKKLGTTYIYVTHDQEEAMTMSDRVVVMQDGKIEQCDEAEKIYYNPANQFVAEFLGETNIIQGRYREDQTESFFEIHNHQYAIKKQQNCPDRISIRPESLILCEAGDNGLQGKIIENIFMGENYRIKVLCSTGETISLLQKTPIAINSRVGLTFPADMVYGI